MSEAADKTLQALEDAVNAHFKQVWEDAGELNQSDYIPDWAVVIAYQDLASESQQADYSVETRLGMHAHQIKGLLNEGIDFVIDAQQEAKDV